MDPMVINSSKESQPNLIKGENKVIKILHFSLPNGNVNSEFLNAVRNFPNVQLNIVENSNSLSKSEIINILQENDVLILSRAPMIPDEIAANPGKLKYICYLHGTMRKPIGLPIIQSNIKVTNWGNTSGPALAEASFTLLMAVFKDLPKRILAVRSGAGQGITSMGTLISKLNIGIYGFGYAGREFAKLIQPFGANIRIFDPYATDIPKYCTSVSSLDQLFSTSQAIVIHAGLTDETQNSITRDLLAKLPDQGIIINTARGAIIDQVALFDELRIGRLRAGLDVLWPDNLPENHEARKWENLIWTCHQFNSVPWPSEGIEGQLSRYQTHLENIKAFTEGKPLQFVIDETRYLRMT